MRVLPKNKNIESISILAISQIIQLIFRYVNISAHDILQIYKNKDTKSIKIFMSPISSRLY